MVPCLVSKRGPPDYKLTGIGYWVDQPWSKGRLGFIISLLKIALIHFSRYFSITDKFIVEFDGFNSKNITQRDSYGFFRL